VSVRDLCPECKGLLKVKEDNAIKAWAKYLNRYFTMKRCSALLGLTDCKLKPQ